MRLIFTIMLPPIPEIHILGRMTQYNVTFEADFWYTCEVDMGTHLYASCILQTFLDNE